MMICKRFHQESFRHYQEQTDQHLDREDIEGIVFYGVIYLNELRRNHLSMINKIIIQITCCSPLLISNIYIRSGICYCHSTIYFSIHDRVHNSNHLRVLIVILRLVLGVQPPIPGLVTSPFFSAMNFKHPHRSSDDAIRAQAISMNQYTKIIYQEYFHFR